MVKTNNLAFKIFTFEKNESKLWIETNQIEYVYLNSPKIFCIILTSKNSLKTKAKTIYNTWAKKCDNFKFITLLPQGLFSNDNFTNQTNFISTEYDYKYYNTWLQPPGLFEDEYSKLTNKIYLAYKYISVNYSEYDWYLKADDDTFIFVDNLKKFVSKKNSSTPVTYGYDFKVIVDKGYHSGGGGYLMSNEAFRRIGSKLNEDFKYCPNTGTEDVDVAKCFRSLEVYPEKSVDELGRERFHPLNIHGHYQGDYPDWMYTYASNPLKKVNKNRLFKILKMI